MEPCDSAILEREVTNIIAAWDVSPAIPADLIPRAAFKCGCTRWATAAWQIVRVCGPGALAKRPMLWKESCLMPSYKRGNPDENTAYRLIYVMVHLALLQEVVMAKRLSNQIIASITPGQSGYTRGVDDPHILLHEVCAMASQQLRSVWLILGDFVGAFPRFLA